MEEGSTGQSPSLGSSIAMISPQTTTAYTRMTFNNNKEKPLTAQLIYAYKLSCSSTNGNGSNGINTTDSATSTGIYSSSSTDSFSTPTGSSTGSLPSPTGSLSTSSTDSLSTSSTDSLSTSLTVSSPSPIGGLNSTGSSGIMIKSKHCNHYFNDYNYFILQAHYGC